jgi:hypothetical protein
MKRSLATALALGALGLALLTGCDRAKAEAPPPTKTTTTTVSTPATGNPPKPVKADVDNQLNDVDGLLNQVDGQLKADSQKVPDED